MKSAPRWQTVEARGLTWDGGQSVYSGFEFRHRLQQRSGVMMSGLIKDIAHRRGLHDLPGVHHRHAVTHIGDNAKIVCDKDEGHAQLALNVLEQFEILRLNRDVERSGRLVGNQQARLAGDGYRADDALLHAAAHLMRIGTHARLG